MTIFISYRRAGTSAHAGRLFDALVERFGEDRVFMDVDTIPAGADFTEVISQAVARCDVVLALFGKTWATATDKNGNRRIDSPDDLVRLELEEALRQNVRILPILVEGAEMPTANDLPTSLAPLVRRHAFEMLDRRWRSDLAELLSVLENLAREQLEEARTQADRRAGAQAHREAEAPTRPDPAFARTRPEMAVELLPPTSKGWRRGKHRVTVTNEGDRSMLVEVRADTPALLLELVAEPSHLGLEPGAKATTWLHVRPRRVLWWGPIRTLPLRVTARSDNSEPVTVETTFAQQPMFPAWSGKALLWPGGLAVVLAVGLLSVLRPWTKPTRSVPVPNCVSLEEARCMQLLSNVGLEAVETPEVSGTAPAGAVIRIEPVPGTIVRVGATVQVVVSVAATSTTGAWASPPPTASGPTTTPA